MHNAAPTAGTLHGSACLTEKRSNILQHVDCTYCVKQITHIFDIFTLGNTAVHYAAAYGWYFTLQLLLDAGANPNVPNDWKTTAAGITFLKGHMGLTDLLLQQPGADINFKDESGELGTCDGVIWSDGISYLIRK